MQIKDVYGGNIALIFHEPGINQPNIAPNLSLLFGRLSKEEWERHVFSGRKIKKVFGEGVTFFCAQIFLWSAIVLSSIMPLAKFRAKGENGITYTYNFSTPEIQIY